VANFSLQDIVSERLPMVTVVDVGAMLEGKSRFAGLVERGMARVIGFEPDPTEYQKLKAQADARHVFLPYFLGNGKPATFHRCRYNGCSSLYTPDPGIIDLFTSLGDPANAFFEVLGTSEEVQACDCLKIDVQGAELDVLKGAVLTLRETAVVEVEVEFVPLYQQQPLFADVDLFMRESGFTFHKFAEVASRALRPFVLDNNPFKPMSQILWANAIYIRPFADFERLAPEVLLKTAIVLHEVYTSIDMAWFALKAYDAKAGTKLSDAYMAKVTAAGQLHYSFMNVV
jgi:FkbM family methyltransferase